MGYVVVHHGLTGQNLDYDSQDVANNILTYLRFMADRPASGTYDAGRLVWEEMLDEQLEVTLFRFSDQHNHNEQLHLLFEVGSSVEELIRTKGDMYERVIRQIRFHLKHGAGELLNLETVGNCIVATCTRSAHLHDVVVRKKRSEMKSV